MKIDIYILSSNDEVRNEIEESLNDLDFLDVIGSTNTIEETIRNLDEKKVDILLVNPEGQQSQYDFVGEVTRKYPLTQVILLEDTLKEQTLHDAIYLGAKDVLIKPYDPQKLIESIARVQDLLKKDKEAAVERRSAQKKQHKGKMITFFSTKGGVGKTFTTINFATALAENTDKRVALVDLDLDYGNSSLALNLPPKFTILDVVNDMQKIDKDLIESYMLPHESGLKILASSVRFEITDHIKGSQVKTILEFLQESFDYVIIDMPGRFSDSSMPGLALADELMLVITPELSTIQNIKNLLYSLKELNFPLSKINLILNKHDNRGDIDLSDISNTLNREINNTIGLDYKRVANSLNKGVPFITEYPNHNISNDIKTLVENITGEKIVTKKGLLSFWRK